MSTINYSLPPLPPQMLFNASSSDIAATLRNLNGSITAQVAELEAHIINFQRDLSAKPIDFRKITIDIAELNSMFNTLKLLLPKCSFSTIGNNIDKILADIEKGPAAGFSSAITDLGNLSNFINSSHLSDLGKFLDALNQLNKDCNANPPNWTNIQKDWDTLDASMTTLAHETSGAFQSALQIMQKGLELLIPDLLQKKDLSGLQTSVASAITIGLPAIEILFAC